MKTDNDNNFAEKKPGKMITLDSASANPSTTIAILPRDGGASFHLWKTPRQRTAATPGPKEDPSNL
jgi:hypothetical protein